VNQGTTHHAILERSDDVSVGHARKLMTHS
jgi:hypothetical protein